MRRCLLFLPTLFALNATGCDGSIGSEGTKSDSGQDEDLDGDGYGIDSVIPSNDSDCDDEGEAGNNEDCDGNDPLVYPGAEEIDNDGIDQDCDGVDGPATGEPSSEPGSPSTEPSNNPSAEPGEGSKDSCSHVSTSQSLFLVLLAILGSFCTRKGRNE